MPDRSLLPPPISTRSVWQRNAASHPLLRANASAPLPDSADVVIVGGGLCGALVAHSLLSLAPETRVVLLEARELASGASGRNAGHCRPDAGRGFPAFAALHGAAQARRILDSERTNLDLYVPFRQNGSDAGTERTRSSGSIG